MRFAKAELKKYPISEVCKVLGVGRSEYYRDSKQPEREEKAAEEAVIR